MHFDTNDEDGGQSVANPMSFAEDYPHRASGLDVYYRYVKEGFDEEIKLRGRNSVAEVRSHAELAEFRSKHKFTVVTMLTNFCSFSRSFAEMVVLVALKEEKLAQAGLLG